jgi:hypothetical protein
VERNPVPTPNQHKPRPVGRPKSRPAGAKFRGVWLTDAEFAAVKECVKRLREKSQK